MVRWFVDGRLPVLKVAWMGSGRCVCSLQFTIYHASPFPVCCASDLFANISWHFCSVALAAMEMCYVLLSDYGRMQFEC